jgi:N-acetylgalactosamine PTS system EIIA component
MILNQEVETTMKYIILIGHGSFAEGLLSAVTMMAGRRDDLLSVSLAEAMDIDEFGRLFADNIQKIQPQDEVILFSDIVGGSPLTTSLQILDNRGLLDGAMVFTGMNMPMVLTAVMQKDILPGLAFKAEILGEGHAGLSEYKVFGNLACEGPI